MNVLLMIVFIICAAVLYTCYKSAKDLEKNSKLPKAPSEDVKQEGCCGIVECGYWIPLWENGEMRKDRYYCNYMLMEIAWTDFINGFLESIILIREIILEWTIMKCFRIIRIMKKHICK